MYEANEHLFFEVPAPVEYDPSGVNADCNEKTCTLTVGAVNSLVDDIERAKKKINDMNNAIEKYVKAYNSRVRTLIECEYGKRQRDATIHYQNEQRTRESIISMGKQIIIAGACAAAL